MIRGGADGYNLLDEALRYTNIQEQDMVGKSMKTIAYNTALCVVGGELAGLCTAISAARHGIPAYASLDELLASDAEAVVVCSATASHTTTLSALPGQGSTFLPKRCWH